MGQTFLLFRNQNSKALSVIEFLKYFVERIFNFPQNLSWFLVILLRLEQA